MANVAGESAEQISQYMTAVWNNFYDGSQTLEHYADVMTALGAATASSTKEIATGLEKFAGVANTVGLSYDYATSALATITATSRQSADIVGTSLKTIFARMQSLKLGEDLEDGTSLSQYTQGLAAVGVQVKDQTGELKNMDQILDETAEKWKVLGSDQKVALAQTVAGIRQYQQFITLMDNWDFMEKNLSVARGSAGELQAQQDIYAESWEASRDRVKAALEDIQDSIINPDTFIGLNDALVPVLNGVSNMVDALGGLGGILVLITFSVTRLFGPQIASGLQNLVFNAKNLVGIGQQNLQQTKSAFVQAAENIEVTSREMAIRKQNLMMQSEMEETLAGFGKTLNLEQQKYVNTHRTLLNELDEEITKQARIADQHKEQVELAKSELMIQADANELPRGNLQNKMLSQSAAEQQQAALLRAGIQAEITHSTTPKTNKLTKAKTNNQMVTINGSGNPDAQKQVLEQLSDQFLNLSETTTRYQEVQSKLKVSINSSDEQLRQFISSIKGAEISTEELEKWDGEQLKTKFKEIKAEAELASQDISALANFLKGAKFNPEQIDELVKHFRQLGISENNIKILTEQMRGEVEKIKVPQGLISFEERLNSFTSGLMTVSMALMAFKNLGSVWQDEDASLGDKITQTMMNLAMILPLVTLGIDMVKEQAKAAGIEIKIAFIEFFAIIAAIAAIVITLTVVINNNKKALDKQSKALNKANEELEKATENYTNAKNAAKEFKDTISNFDAGKKELEGLNKGTEEYKNKVDELNNALLEVINKYDILGGYSYDTNTGLIQLDSEAQKQLEQQIRNSEIGARQNLLLKQQVVNSLKPQQVLDTVQTNIRDETVSQTLGQRYLSELKSYYSPYPDFIEDLTTGKWISAGIDWLKIKLNHTKNQQGIGLIQVGVKPLIDSLAAEINNGIKRGQVEKLEPIITKIMGSTSTMDLTDEIIDDIFNNADDALWSKVKQSLGENLDLVDDDIKVISSLLEKDLITPENLRTILRESRTNAQQNKTIRDEYAGWEVARTSNSDIYTSGKSEEENRKRVEVAGAYVNRQSGSNEAFETEQQRFANNGNDVAHWVYEIKNDLNADNEFKAAIAEMEEQYALNTLEGRQKAYGALTQHWNLNDVEVDNENKLIKNKLTGEEIALPSKEEIQEGIMQAMFVQAWGQTSASKKAGQRVTTTQENYLPKLEAAANITGVNLTPLFNDAIANGELSADTLQNWVNGLNGGLVEYLSTQMNNASTSNDVFNILKQSFGLNNKQVKTIFGDTIDPEVIKNALDNYDASNLIQSLTSTATKISEATASVYESALGGTLTANDENLQKIKNSAAEILSIAPELKDEINILNNDAYIGTEEWYEALATVSDKLEELDQYTITYDDNMREIQKQLSNTNLDQTELDNLENRLKEIAETQIEINIISNAEREVNKITGATKGLETALGKISKNGIVAADDIQAVSDALPGVLDNYKDMANGSIQLDKETLASKLKTVKEKIKADNKETDNYLQAIIDKETIDIQAIDTYIASLDDKGGADQGYAEEAQTLEQTLNENKLTIDGKAVEEYGKITDTKNGVENKDEQESYDNYVTYSNAMLTTSKEMYQQMSDGFKAALAGHFNSESMPGVTGGAIKFQTGAGSEAAAGAGSADYSLDDQDLQSLKDPGLSNEEKIKIANEMKARHQKRLNDATTLQAIVRARNGELDSFNGGLGSDSGGGGGGGSSNEIDRTPQELADDLEQVNRELQVAQDHVDTIEEQLEGAPPAKQIELTNRKVQELNKVVARSNDVVKAANTNLNRVKKDLLDTTKIDWSKIQLTPNFDANGEITNLQQIRQKLVDYYNTSIAKVKTEEEATKLQEYFDTANEGLDDYIAHLDTYNESVKTSEDNTRKLAEAMIEKQTLVMEIKLELTEFNKGIREINAAFAELANDNSVAAVNAFNSMMDQSKLIPAQEATLKSLWAEVQKGTPGALDAWKTQKENLEKIIKQIIDDYKAYFDSMQKVDKQFFDDIDNVIKQFDNQTKKLNNISAVLKLINENDKAALRETTKLEAEATRRLNDAGIQTERDAIREANRRRAELLTELQNATSDLDQQAIQKELDYIDESITKGQEKILNYAKSNIEQLQTIYKNGMEQIVEDFDNKMTNGIGWDLYKSKYDNFIDEEERYLDAVNKEYEVTKLNNKLQSSLDKTVSNRSKQILKNLQNEFKIRESNTDLAKYDVDLMNAKYEMTLKQIALEEAQNAKNSVRLVRNASGNWTYQFTADQTAIDKAQEEYLDAQNKYYNLTKDYVKTTANTRLEIEQQISQAIAKLNNTALTDKQRKAYINQLDFLVDKYNDFAKEGRKATKDFTEAGSSAMDNFTNRFALDAEGMTKSASYIDSTVSSAVAQAKRLIEEYSTGVQAESAKSSDALLDMTNSHKELSDVLAIEADNVDNVLNSATNAMNKIFTQDNLNKFDILISKLKTISSVLSTSLDSWDSFTNSDMYKEAQDKLSASANIDYSAMAAKYIVNTQGQYKNKTVEQIMSEPNFQGILKARQQKLENLGRADDTEALKTMLLNADAATLKKYASGISDQNYLDFRKDAFNGQAYGTGGYTGEFADAKLAFLHEKELVLNQSDTKNILGAVATMRAMEPSLLSAIASNVNAGFGLMNSKLGGIKIPTKDNDGITQNNVITANFPAVKSAAEIETALTNLMLDASQFVNLKE